METINTKTVDSPLVAVVIVNWNGWQDTLACLDSLQHLNYKNHVVIIVDNASTDDSVQRIQSAYPYTEIIQSITNLGFAGGNNLGIERALELQAEYVWLLNNDTEVDAFALHHLVERMMQNPRIGMCGSTLVYHHDRQQHQGLAGARYNRWRGLGHIIGQYSPVTQPLSQQEVERQLDYIIGASLLVSCQCIREIGLLAEDYFLYYEEIDWAERCRGKYTLGYAPGSIVYHKEGKSIGSSHIEDKAKRLRSEYYMIRSRLRFTRKFFPYASLTVMLNILLTIVIRLLRLQWGRAVTLSHAFWLTLTQRPLPKL